ncbi:MATE family efflux transporter [Enterocloster clostridioformis]|uniref:MATE family efflux transporter n=1 Tax=Enterocloster clostridioformis TaxID=1531 RepID=UPI0026770EDE|nr:MATE family efflux transporter [Enterocloster clostridioformis]
MDNTLAKKFTFRSLVLFSIPNIITMVFMSLYSIVDGICVSHFVETDGLSAVNIVYPMVSIELAVSIMLAAGGSSLIARKMGEGRNHEAKSDFTMIVLVSLLLGALIAVLSLAFMRPLLGLLGAGSGSLYELCHEYFCILIAFAPAFLLQTIFQYGLIDAGKPALGMVMMILAGVANIVLDIVFMGSLNMGIRGAAVATVIGYCIPTLFGFIYFSVRKSGTLCFVKPLWNLKTIVQTCSNGAAQMVSNLSTAVTTFLFNITVLRLIGEDGVAAISILLYAQYIFTAVYLGYSSGVAPIFSYNFGNGDKVQLRGLLKNSLIFIVLCSVVSFAISILGAGGITSIFAPDGSPVYDIAVGGFAYFSVGFLFMGTNLFTSAFFTALSDGKTASLLSMLRILVFLTAGILLLPRIAGVTGIWLAVPCAELLALALSVACLRKKQSHIWICK